MIAARSILPFKTLLVFLAVAFLVVASPVFAQSFPELSGRVVDQADLLNPAQEAELTAKLAELEAQSNRQLVVATVNSLEGYDIADYGYRLGRTWGIGQDGEGETEKDNGLLLLVAPNERKVRVEVGYGLEGIMTDALSSIIIQNDILPQFRDNNMAGGIIAGADRISTQLTLPDDEARLIAKDAAQQSSQGDGENIGLIIFWAFVLIFFVIIPMFSNRGGKRYRRGAGPVVIWGGGSGWGGGSSGGGFGGGGFSGGGGSFGGGGASGGW
ncbi:TPM domain-containing protein [Parasphingorhabdus sp.]|uniref:TPM domain-containing protein n=1 Tax=Parasphingorhabdus sp. TaxID=2709688 RepID=UPI0032EE097F